MTFKYIRDSNMKGKHRDLPDGPVVKTPGFNLWTEKKKLKSVNDFKRKGPQK